MIVGWLLVAAAVVAAFVLLLVATSPGPRPEPAPTQTPNGEAGNGSTGSQPGSYAGWPVGVPQSADAAERWFAQQHPAPVSWPVGVPRSADAAERWFAQQHPAPVSWPVGVPRSADAAERWFAQAAPGPGELAGGSTAVRRRGRALVRQPEVTTRDDESRTRSRVRLSSTSYGRSGRADRI